MRHVPLWSSSCISGDIVIFSTDVVKLAGESVRTLPPAAERTGLTAVGFEGALSGLLLLVALCLGPAGECLFDEGECIVFFVAGSSLFSELPVDSAESAYPRHFRQPSKSIRACMHPHSVTFCSNHGKPTG